MTYSVVDLPVPTWHAANGGEVRQCDDCKGIWFAPPGGDLCPYCNDEDDA